MERKITFIIGGVRSGKSSFAMSSASEIEGPKAYIATSEALDDEMKDRIAIHRKSRGAEWHTFEEPLKITDTLSEITGKYNAVVLDCLTLWLSNLMHKSTQPANSINEFIDMLASLSRSNSLNSSSELNGLNLFIISNEVGMGIVPDNKMAREFRDLAGSLNQKIATSADEVYLVTAGIPIKIKDKK
jgi:adenosylcobinamide kinase/adenosylcobinamide-phosphate guanylyltransferase